MGCDGGGAMGCEAVRGARRCEVRCEVRCEALQGGAEKSEAMRGAQGGVDCRRGMAHVGWWWYPG